MVKMLPMGEFMDEFFNVAEMFNPLKLTDGEIGLFTSTLIICPERKGIKNVRAVRKLQSLLFQCLYALIKKNHFDYDNVFMKAVSTMRTFKVVNLKHRIALNSMQMQAPSKDMFPPLHCEVFEHGDCSTEDSKKIMKLLTLKSLDGHININVCKYGTCVSLTLDNGRFPMVR